MAVTHRQLELKLPDIVKKYELMEVPAGTKVFSQGQSCNHYTVVAAGTVRVLTRSPDGRELVLYHVSAGEICVLTMACLMGGTRYPSEAITETPVSAYIIPGPEYERLIAESAEFRQFVFNSFSLRMADLMSKLEKISLESIDERLIHYLESHVQDDRHVRATHQQVADDIGSAREVVSRHLKRLEQDGFIRLRRGSIEILRL